MPIKESTRAGGERRAVVRSVNAIIGISALVTAAFAAVFGEADAFYFTAAVSFICWAIDWVLCRRRPKQRDRNALAAIAGFTVLLGYALGRSCAPAHADPIDDKAFILTLDSYGITYTSPEYAIAQGRSACTSTATYGVMPTVQAVYLRVPSFSQMDAAHFVGASIGAYCPWLSTAAQQQSGGRTV